MLLFSDVILCLLLVVIALSGQSIANTRNDAEEAICQPFLTSAATSPLNIKIMPRNLTIDEDGEFACLLVLQDTNLPMQIRVTIHEGLMWLGIRHVHMGLPHHHMIAYHLDHLTKLLPKVSSFHIKAAEWSLDPHIANYHQAKDYYLAVYNGSCQHDPLDNVAEDEVYYQQRRFAEVLGYLGYHDDAKYIYSSLLQQYPIDFTVAFLLQELLIIMKNNNTDNDQHDDKDSEMESKLLQASSSFYDTIIANSKHLNHYDGYIPNYDDYEVKRYHHLLSQDEIDDHIRRREPFVISLDSSLNLSTSFGWRTEQWQNLSYLLGHIDDQQKVQVEYHHHHDDQQQKPGLMGYGLNNYRKVTTFHNFIKHHHHHHHRHNKSASSSSSEYDEAYLNVQLDDLRYDLNPFLHPHLDKSSAIPAYYNPPLHLLVDDIPMPSMLHHLDMTQINLWMNAPYSPSSSNEEGDNYDGSTKSMRSRLHVDATDNLYVLLQGSKEFVVVDPSQASLMKTILPTYAVAKNGLSFRYNPILYPIHHHDSHHDSYHHPPTYSQDVSTGHFSSIASLGDEVGIKSVTTRLEAGDILYLPTGWFHQVTSSSSSLTGSMHMAINYWWKPPQWQGQQTYYSIHDLLDCMIALPHIVMLRVVDMVKAEKEFAAVLKSATLKTRATEEQDGHHDDL